MTWKHKLEEIIGKLREAEDAVITSACQEYFFFRQGLKGTCPLAACLPSRAVVRRGILRNLTKGLDP